MLEEKRLRQRPQILLQRAGQAHRHHRIDAEGVERLIGIDALDRQLADPVEDAAQIVLDRELGPARGRCCRGRGCVGEPGAGRDEGGKPLGTPMEHRHLCASQGARLVKRLEPEGGGHRPDAGKAIERVADGRVGLCRRLPTVAS